MARMVLSIWIVSSACLLSAISPGVAVDFVLEGCGSGTCERSRRTSSSLCQRLGLLSFVRKCRAEERWNNVWVIAERLWLSIVD